MNEMEKIETIARAKELRRADELEESQDLLLSLLEEYPTDPQVLFEMGGAYDVMGYEDKAIPYYEEAIEEGLDGAELQECLICLGSCHRVIGEAQKSVEVLEEAVDQFPDNNSGRVFLALAYYSNDQYEEAVRTLLGLLLSTTEDEDILSYKDTFEYYKDNLDEEWDVED